MGKYYLSYLMGASQIGDEELVKIGVEIVSRKESGSRELKIPDSNLGEYTELIKRKLDNGFWNEIIGVENIFFIFKFKDGQIKEYTLSEENQAEIDRLCAEFNDEEPDEAPNVYKFLSENEFYHDFMISHYPQLVDK